jgi:two-component system, OmpR family, phosphate regulon response regulator PhoB
MADNAQVPPFGACVGIVRLCDEQLSVWLTDDLTAVGYTVQSYCGEESWGGFVSSVPDVLILGWATRAIGLNLLRQIRAETKSTPIIILAEQAAENDVIAALGAGADDILSTPCSMPELLARVEALLRRKQPVSTSNVVTAGDTEFDREAVIVRRRGKTVALGPTDRQLLDLFMTHPGEILGRHDILLAVWGQNGAIDARTIDVHVGRLRKALLTACRSDPITTIRGTGYRFDPK